MTHAHTDTGNPIAYEPQSNEDEPARMWPLLAKIAVSVAVLGWIGYNTDLIAVAGVMAAADPGYLAISVGWFAVLLIVQAGRWGLVLTALGVALPLTLRVRSFYIGQFFNQTLPSTIGGDAMRIWMLRDKVSLRDAAHGVLCDRLVALFSMLLLSVAGLPWLAELDNDGRAVISVSAAFAAGFIAMLGIACLDLLPGPLARHKWLTPARALSVDLRRVLLNIHPGPAVVLISVLVHANAAVVVWWLALGLDAHVTLWQCLVLVPPIMVVSAIPISVAGWGVREGAMVAAFSLTGMPAETAFATSLLFGLTLVAIGLPGGILWLLERGANAPPRSDLPPPRSSI